MKYFENRTYRFGGRATNRAIEITGVRLEEYLAESSHSHTCRELWGPGVLASVLLHKVEGDDLEKAEWDLVSRTIVAVMNGNCPPTEALAIQGFVAELIADVVMYFRDAEWAPCWGADLVELKTYKDTIDWAVCELAGLCRIDLALLLGSGRWSVQMSDWSAEMVRGEFVLLEPVSWQSDRDRNHRLVVVPNNISSYDLLITQQLIESQP